MCLAAPSKVIEIRDDTAVTECFGQTREVSLLLMMEEVAVGDYLLIQAGGFAFERIDPERAQESLALMAEILEQGSDARAWGDGRCGAVAELDCGAVAELD
ncbi:MAG: hydrogenase assembly protein HupF [Rhodocyclales bacterium GWA2_65_20]|nr:MAG: hydrogenase assembly protein HupF [Rhodocyclales bacterium GWA2_65_20]